MPNRVPALVPTLAGAIAATAALLLVGLPPGVLPAGGVDLADTGELVAAVAVVLVAVLVIVSAAATPRPRRAAFVASAPVRHLPVRGPAAPVSSARRAA
jgi:hypothetical protein